MARGQACAGESAPSHGSTGSLLGLRISFSKQGPGGKVQCLVARGWPLGNKLARTCTTSIRGARMRVRETMDRDEPAIYMAALWLTSAFYSHTDDVVAAAFSFYSYTARANLSVRSWLCLRRECNAPEMFDCRTY